MRFRSYYLDEDSDNFGEIGKVNQISDDIEDGPF